MKTKPAYLVLRSNGRATTINRVTQSWPTLASGEVIVRLSLELPDDFLTNPVHTIEIGRDELALAAEVFEPQEGGD